MGLPQELLAGSCSRPSPSPSPTSCSNAGRPCTSPSRNASSPCTTPNAGSSCTTPCPNLTSCRIARATCRPSHCMASSPKSSSICNIASRSDLTCTFVCCACCVTHWKRVCHNCMPSRTGRAAGAAYPPHVPLTPALEPKNWLGCMRGASASMRPFHLLPVTTNTIKSAYMSCNMRFLASQSLLGTALHARITW